MNSNERTTRRRLLRRSTAALAGLSLGGLPSSLTQGAETTQETTRPHHSPVAQRVIVLFMHGGPSQVDTFDYKPLLQKHDGRELPFQAASNIDAAPRLLKSPWRFRRYGESGNWVSELLPNMAKHIDDMCVIRSMHSRGQ